ncbi:MAG: type II toxin-antitoxin system HipA family toxin [Actinomycetota bacterium]|nr:type II toxin-antitoxin system HipA family toxin [Actinomycetota bacterium]
MTLAEVKLWDDRVGAVELANGDDIATFQYEPAFVARGFDVSPLTMPRREAPFSFPGLARGSFDGLPGLLADSLPDRYGHALINAWLARQGRTPSSFDSVERLCYIGRRGIGALEFEPAFGPDPSADEAINVAELADLAAEILARREALSETLATPRQEHALEQILRVGTSAGGARAKAVVALNPETEEVRSGQLDLGPGFEHWILKFDGVEDESRELGEGRGYGTIEWVYSELARRAGIEMAECRLLSEGGRSHFMTRRFDRRDDGSKVHMQSLAAMLHLDFNQAGAHSYEQAFDAIRRLGLPRHDVEQQFRRMVFNVVARNQDDHVKNIAFLMDSDGAWRLSPAFDATYAYNPSGRWTSLHQMTINGKRDDHTLADFAAVGDLASMKRGEAKRIAGEVIEAVSAWPELGSEAGIGDARVAEIKSTLRLDLADRS